MLVDPHLLPSPSHQNTHILISRTCYFRSVIKWRILKWGNYPGLSGLALNTITGSFSEGGKKVTGGSRRCDNGTKDLQSYRESWLVMGCRWPPDARKGKDINSPLVSPEEISPADSSTLAQWNWFGTSDLQSAKRVNLCCFKPINWYTREKE